jgi:hypothetical protein
MRVHPGFDLGISPDRTGKTHKPMH